MSILVGRHFLDFEGLNSQNISSFFSKVDKLDFQQNLKPNNHVVAHLFFEPSTRTQLSFNLATIRCGAQPLNFSFENSSLKKGETFQDTLSTVQAMGISAMVIRHGYPESLKQLAQNLNISVINAGEGTSGHPTQALLDAYTLLKERGRIEGEKVLFIGDIEHSRVARSNFEILSIMGAKIGICAPKEWLPRSKDYDYTGFESLEEGLKWATAVMTLRIQKERHDIRHDFDIKKYQLNGGILNKIKSDAIIMHPAPFNRDVEITNDVLEDPRCVIWKQVTNGVKVRTVLLKEILKLQ